MNNDQFVSMFLSKFYYSEWEFGNDDVLRIGDYVILAYQDPYTGLETFVPARIDLFEDALPAFIVNEERNNLGTSGEYISIFDTLLKGYDFYRTNRENWMQGLSTGS